MKKAFLLLTASLFFFLVKAQKYEDIKKFLILNNYQQAKTDLDKAMTNAKFTAKAEAYMLKTTVYAGMAMQDGTKGTTQGDQLTSEAEAAFMKYKEMEPEMTLVSDPIYQNGPINLYSGYYASGYVDYSAKKWEASYGKFKKAAELSDILIAKKILTTTLDTNVLILAAVTAENSNKKEEAARYYTRLADHKVTGDGFESVYRFLVNYYFTKKDIPAFEKYKALGKELYPKSEYFNYDKIDFAIGLETGFNSKVKALEEMIAADPNGYKANEILAEIIYDTLNSRAEGAVQPANADELEIKMVAAFKKAAAAKPESENTWLFIGDHFINKAVKINDEREAHAKEMKARTKPGAMASKEDIAKRDMLDKKYSEALEGAREPYEKAAGILSVKPKNEDKNKALRDKQQYKKAVSYLADIFANKKVNAKGKPADVAKYTAEEKKWNDLYDSIGSVSSSNDNKTSGNGTIIKMQEQSGGTYKVPCKLNGLTMVFIFDSGASDVSISLTEASFMLKNGYLKPQDIVSTEQYRIANGELVEGLIINIRELIIGNYILNDVKGSIVSSTNAPLLLGMSAIKKLGFKFDPSQGTLFK